MTDSTDSTDSTDPAGADDGAPVPVVRVVAGIPTDEEVAALAAVLTAVAGAGAAEVGERHTVSAWSSRERALRGATVPGAGGWRSSALPR